MKTIGLLGGVSWHSTLEYYRLINDLINQKLGGFQSAKMQIYSFNFQEIRDLHNSSETKLCNRLVEEAQKLEKSGADCLLIGANTLHLFFDAIQSKLNIPVIHIADAIAKKIKAKGLRKVALLGTLTTMEKSFYSERLKLKNIQTIIPDVMDRKIIDSIIFNELVKGILSADSKEIYLKIIDKLIKEDLVEGVILACTEIPLLIKASDTKIPLFNSTEIHVIEAVEFALSEN